ncbi:XRE family transcriptional regulator [Clostridium perfringens]|uniref:helix-turn-helix domain-containing protein n=1 Tax=Clostridium perfringens TaxID=1502 RepID=UPI000D715EDB|nr:helix-turn-helix transcriptional regulator [Clostridium perfringens]PWX16697.1 XRE family transcriptional regulator [Clostridium perfringens]
MLCDNLKKIRNEKNIGIRKLARISGVSHIIIINIESGKSRNPTITSIMKLAKALDITIDKLVYGEA